LFKHGGGAQPTTTPSASAPTTSAPSAPTSPASTPAPASAPSAKTPASTPTPAKSPPKKASAPPKPSSPKPASTASSQPAGTAPAATPAGAAAPAAAAALDLTGLEQRLRETKAIGMFTKLSLKNQVDDLLTQFKAFHNKQAKLSQSDLRQRYDLLLLKVLSLLQDDDPSLASAISSSREAIWGILIDPVKFAKLS
jgi:hypothetical protein